MEEEKTIIHKKSFCNEYEEIFNKRESITNLDKFNLNFEDIEELSYSNRKASSVFKKKFAISVQSASMSTLFSPRNSSTRTRSREFFLMRRL